MSIWNRRSVVLSLSGIMIPEMCQAQNSQAATQGDAAGSVKQALSVFLTAFDNLDWPAFRVCFADDVTMFHPAAPNIKRIDSAEAFEKAWLGVFARIKAQSGRSSPPYMDLQPQDLRMQMLSPELSLVTFHLFDGDTTSRRSIVLRQDSGGWKIVHLHASNITKP